MIGLGGRPGRGCQRPELAGPAVAGSARLRLSRGHDSANPSQPGQTRVASIAVPDEASRTGRSCISSPRLRTGPGPARGLLIEGEAAGPGHPVRPERATIPRTDEAGFLDFARSLPSRLLVEAIQDAEPLSPIFFLGFVPRRIVFRHFEGMARWPAKLPGPRGCGLCVQSRLWPGHDHGSAGGPDAGGVPHAAARSGREPGTVISEAVGPGERSALAAGDQ